MKVIAFHPELRRPGCVLIQAVLGGDAELIRRFPSETWLIGGEADGVMSGMRLYPVTDDLVAPLIEVAIEATRQQNPPVEGAH